MGWIEILGYVSSILVLISLSMKSLVKLRWLNAIGSFLFTIFALLTYSYPTALVNIGIIFVDVYFLVKLNRVKDSFDIVPVGKEDKMMLYFYDRNKAEIERIFGADCFNTAEKFAFYMRNNDIAGLLAYSDTSVNTAKIQIDYVSSKYRDCSVGKYVFETDLAFWKNQNISLLEVDQPSATHIPYLESIGFSQQHNPSIWAKNI